MNKSALIVGTNLHWTPFYYRYENILNELNLPFDLLIWNREGLSEKSAAKNIYEFKSIDIANNKNPLKVIKFIRFSNFVKRTLKKENYNKIVFVGTYGCTVAFCANYLSKNFKNKMWIDIRDDLYEWFKPYYNAQKRTIEASYATAISSPAYTKFLPEYDYLFMHNIDPNASELIKKFNYVPDKEGRIRISFIGNVRYYEQNKQLLSLLGDDNRFVLQYYGKGSEQLKEYCIENNITNVDFHGAFAQEETINFYEKTDIINNMYGNDTMNLQLALSNKLYYGLFLKLPILVSENTLMEELTKEYNVGFTFINDSNFADNLYDWYQNIQCNKSNCRFDELWNRFLEEDNYCVKKLEEFLASTIN
jgi:hypothetical protein